MPGLFRNVPVWMLLVAGVAWSLPVEPGYGGHGADKPNDSALAVPALRLTVRGDDLHLQSHTISLAHERQLADIARRGGKSPTLEFLALGIAPRQWSSATLGLVEAGQTMLAASIEATGNFAVIKGVVDAGFDRYRLHAALPESLVVDQELIAADTRLSAGELCDREFAAFDPGVIRFEESGTSLRTSAYPALDRIVTLADACRRSRVVITGHTDASGGDDANRILSLARARVVADLIAARGIDRSRLVTFGAGSTQPLSANNTRYGRSLNRRIEVTLEAVD